MWPATWMASVAIPVLTQCAPWCIGKQALQELVKRGGSRRTCYQRRADALGAGAAYVHAAQFHKCQLRCAAVLQVTAVGTCTFCSPFTRLVGDEQHQARKFVACAAGWSWVCISILDSELRASAQMLCMSKHMDLEVEHPILLKSCNRAPCF